MPPEHSGSVDVLDESLLYFGLLIGAMMTGWSLWMLVIYIRRTPEQRKRSSVGLWIILLALLLGLGALGKPMRELIQRWTGDSQEQVLQDSGRWKDYNPWNPGGRGEVQKMPGLFDQS